MSRAGYVYAIQKGTEQKIKIGHGVNPIRRLQALQTGNDVELTIYATKYYQDRITAETTIHRILDAWKVTHTRKNEWFTLTKESQHLIDIIFGKKQANSIETQQLQRLQLL